MYVFFVCPFFHIFTSHAPRLRILCFPQRPERFSARKLVTSHILQDSMNTSAIDGCHCGSNAAYHPSIPTLPMDESYTEDTAVFSLFTEFPPEPQDAIWDSALPGARIVYLQAKRITRGQTWSDTLRQRDRGERIGLIGDKKTRVRSLKEDLRGELGSESSPTCQISQQKLY